MSDQPDSLLWKVDRTAKELDVSPRTLFSITAPRGDLPCVRLGPTGRMIRYDPDVVREYIKKHASSH